VFDLIGNRDFPNKVDDIVVECGNSRYQPALDRYIAGEDVPISEIRKVWRDTTQPSCGFPLFYETLFPLVRRVNSTLPPDPHIATVVKNEVLAKGRRALMLFGPRHLAHGFPGNAVGLYERDYPGVTYVVAYHVAGRVGRHVLPGHRGRRSRGAWLSRVDAYLYLGPRDVLLREQVPVRALLDPDYLAELNRRADVEGMPPDAPMRPAAVLQREAEAGVLLHER
jgi:hypothetical protein